MAINPLYLQRIQQSDNLVALSAIALAGHDVATDALFYDAVRAAVLANKDTLNEEEAFIGDAVAQADLPDAHVETIRNAAALRYVQKKLMNLTGTEAEQDALLNALIQAADENTLRQQLVSDDAKQLLEIQLDQAYQWDEWDPGEDVFPQAATEAIKQQAAVAQFKAKVAAMLARNEPEDQDVIAAIAQAGDADAIAAVLGVADNRARLGNMLPQAQALLAANAYELFEDEIDQCRTHRLNQISTELLAVDLDAGNAVHFLAMARAENAGALSAAIGQIGPNLPQASINFDSHEIKQLQAQAARKYVEYIIQQVERAPGAAADYDNRNVLMAIAACDDIDALKTALRHGGGAAALLNLDADPDHAHNAMADALNDADFNAIRREAAARLFTLGIDNGVVDATNADAAADAAGDPPTALQQTIDRLERLARASDDARASQQLNMAALTLDTDGAGTLYTFPNMGHRMVVHGLTEAVQQQAGWHYLDHIVNTKAADAITINDKDALTELAKAADANAFIAELPRLGIKIDEQQIRDGFAGLKQNALNKLMQVALLPDNTSTEELRGLAELEGDDFRDGLSRIIFGEGVAGVITAINYPDAALEQAKAGIIPNLMNDVYTEPMDSDDPDAPAATVYSEQYLNRMQALASAADANAFRALLNAAPYNLGAVTPAILSDDNVAQLQRKAAFRVLRGKIVAAVTQPSQSHREWSQKFLMARALTNLAGGNYTDLLNGDADLRDMLGLSSAENNQLITHLHGDADEATEIRQHAAVVALTFRINQNVAAQPVALQRAQRGVEAAEAAANAPGAGAAQRQALAHARTRLQNINDLANKLIHLKNGLISGNIDEGDLRYLGIDDVAGDANVTAAHTALRGLIVSDDLQRHRPEMLQQINGALFRLKFNTHLPTADTRLDGMFQHFQRLSLEQQNEILRTLEADPDADAKITSLVNARSYVDFNLAMEDLGFRGDESFRNASRDFETKQQQLKLCSKVHNYHIARTLKGMISRGVDLDLTQDRVNAINARFVEERGAPPKIRPQRVAALFGDTPIVPPGGNEHADQYSDFVNNLAADLGLDGTRRNNFRHGFGLPAVGEPIDYSNNRARDLRNNIVKSYCVEAAIRQALKNPRRRLQGKAFLHHLLTKDTTSFDGIVAPFSADVAQFDQRVDIASQRFLLLAYCFSQAQERHDFSYQLRAHQRAGGAAPVVRLSYPAGYFDDDEAERASNLDFGSLPRWLQGRDDQNNAPRSFLSEQDFNAIKKQQKLYDYVLSRVNPEPANVVMRRFKQNLPRDVRTLKDQKKKRIPQNYFSDEKARKVYEDMRKFARVAPDERIVLLRPDKKGREEGTILVGPIKKLLNASRNIMQQQQQRIDVLELIYSQADELRPGAGADTLRDECTGEIGDIRRQLETLQLAENRLQSELQYAREMASSSIDYTVFINEYTKAGAISDASELDAIIDRTRGQTRAETQAQVDDRDRVAVIGTTDGDGINTHSNLRVSFARDVARGQCQQIDIWVDNETPAPAPGADPAAAPPATRRVYAQAIKVDAATRPNQPRRAQMYLSGFPPRAEGAQQQAADEMRARYALITMSKYITDRQLRKTKGGKLRRDFQSSVPNKQHRISIKARDPQEAQLLWHACVWLGQNTPGAKWGPEAIDTSQSAFKPVEGQHYDRGWFNKLSFPEGAPMRNFQADFATINGEIGITHATAQGLAARSTSQVRKSADKKEVRDEYKRRTEIFKGVIKDVEKTKGGDELVERPRPTGPGAGG